MKNIPVSGPWITDKEVEYVADAARHAWYENANMYHVKFERAFANYLSVKHAIALPSCTSAIHLCLLALGIGPGDEVIVPDVTWIATAAPISYVGATPVFADIDYKTWCLSPKSFRECISKRTKAVIPVDLYGGVPDWDNILAIAHRHDIHVIEDAAEAIGSEFKGKKAGALGDAGCFSFHGSKTITTGEGGMLVSNQDKIINKAHFLMDHGRKPGDVMFFNEAVGYKYKMSALQAALGFAQIERIEEIVEKKRKIFSWYSECLSDIEGISLNYESGKTRNSYWMVSVVIDPDFGLNKKTLITLLTQRRISCRPFFYPLSAIPAFSSTKEAQKARLRNKVSYQLSPTAINLPSGLNLDKDTVGYVCNTFKEIILEQRAETKKKGVL